MSRADDSAAKLLSEDEARRIAANLAEQIKRDMSGSRCWFLR